ncbi:hypothetical protein Tco_0875972 [Tanacetum coccineum]|uniref:Uncharacterized protein n=1 Tax=Tanacetum coccineum TaxID=301880 RepID=A0ABQ5BTT6_9ASTR
MVEHFLTMSTGQVGLEQCVGGVVVKSEWCIGDETRWSGVELTRESQASIDVEVCGRNQGELGGDRWSLEMTHINIGESGLMWCREDISCTWVHRERSVRYGMWCPVWYVAGGREIDSVNLFSNFSEKGESHGQRVQRCYGGVLASRDLRRDENFGDMLCVIDRLGHGVVWLSKIGTTLSVVRLSVSSYSVVAISVVINLGGLGSISCGQTGLELGTDDLGLGVEVGHGREMSMIRGLREDGCAMETFTRRTSKVCVSGSVCRGEGSEYTREMTDILMRLRCTHNLIYGNEERSAVHEVGEEPTVAVRGMRWGSEFKRRDVDWWQNTIEVGMGMDRRGVTTGGLVDMIMGVGFGGTTQSKVFYGDGGGFVMTGEDWVGMETLVTSSGCLERQHLRVGDYTCIAGREEDTGLEWVELGHDTMLVGKAGECGVEDAFGGSFVILIGWMDNRVGCEQTGSDVPRIVCLGHKRDSLVRLGSEGEISVFYSGVSEFDTRGWMSYGTRILGWIGLEFGAVGWRTMFDCGTHGRRETVDIDCLWLSRVLEWSDHMTIVHRGHAFWIEDLEGTYVEVRSPDARWDGFHSALRWDIETVILIEEILEVEKRLLGSVMTRVNIGGYGGGVRKEGGGVVVGLGGSGGRVFGVRLGGFVGLRWDWGWGGGDMYCIEEGRYGHNLVGEQYGGVVRSQRGRGDHVGRQRYHEIYRESGEEIYSEEWYVSRGVLDTVGVTMWTYESTVERSIDVEVATLFLDSEFFIGGQCFTERSRGLIDITYVIDVVREGTTIHDIDHNVTVVGLIEEECKESEGCISRSRLRGHVVDGAHMWQGRHCDVWSKRVKGLDSGGVGVECWRGQVGGVWLDVNGGEVRRVCVTWRSAWTYDLLVTVCSNVSIVRGRTEIQVGANDLDIVIPIPPGIDERCFNAESDLLESLLNRDSPIDSTKIDFIFDEFSLPRPPEIPSSQSFSQIPMEEIDLFLDNSIPPGIDNDDDSEGDILPLEELLDNVLSSSPSRE